MDDILKELNVEKLNICEPDGTVKMSLFNSRNIPSLIIDGEDILPGHRSKDGVSGIIFYNNHGDECGGLIHGSDIDEDGKVSMGMSLTFDKWKQDQVLQMNLQKDGDKELYGISIYDRPKKNIKNTLFLMNELQKETDKEKQKILIREIRKNNHKRIFVGHDVDGDTKISLCDSNGKEKLKIFINDNNELKFIVDGKEIKLS